MDIIFSFPIMPIQVSMLENREQPSGMVLSALPCVAQAGTTNHLLALSLSRQKHLFFFNIVQMRGKGGSNPCTNINVADFE